MRRLLLLLLVAHAFRVRHVLVRRPVVVERAAVQRLAAGVLLLLLLLAWRHYVVAARVVLVAARVVPSRVAGRVRKRGRDGIRVDVDWPGSRHPSKRAGWRPERTRRSPVRIGLRDGHRKRAGGTGWAPELARLGLRRSVLRWNASHLLLNARQER